MIWKTPGRSYTNKILYGRPFFHTLNSISGEKEQKNADVANSKIVKKAAKSEMANTKIPGSFRLLAI